MQIEKIIEKLKEDYDEVKNRIIPMSMDFSIKKLEAMQFYESMLKDLEAAQQTQNELIEKIEVIINKNCIDCDIDCTLLCDTAIIKKILSKYKGW